jgi:hypothetical protein
MTETWVPNGDGSEEPFWDWEGTEQELKEFLDEVERAGVSRAFETSMFDPETQRYLVRFEHGGECYVWFNPEIYRDGWAWSGRTRNGCEHGEPAMLHEKIREWKERARAEWSDEGWDIWNEMMVKVPDVAHFLAERVQIMDKLGQSLEHDLTGVTPERPVRLKIEIRLGELQD